MTSRGPYRRHSTPFKLQLCQDIWAGVIGRRDAQLSHNIFANVMQLWLTLFGSWELTNEEVEASVIAKYETRAAVKRKVYQLTIELNLAKKNTVDEYESFADVAALLPILIEQAHNPKLLRSALGYSPPRNSTSYSPRRRD